MELLLLAAAVAAYVAWRRRGSPPWRAPGRRTRHTGHPPGAGASAAARAAALRRQARGGPGRQMQAALGLDPAGGRQRAQAARWEAGAEGERRTAGILAQLGPGWVVLHDRALPSGRANIDHLVIAPGGVVFVVDAKLWSARWPVTTSGGRLLHGRVDRTDAVASVIHEARAAGEVLGVSVTPLIAVHGAAVARGGFQIQGVRVIPAAELLGVLRASARGAAVVPVEVLARRARAGLPPYPN